MGPDLTCRSIVTKVVYEDEEVVEIDAAVVVEVEYDGVAGNLVATADKAEADNTGSIV